MAKKHNVEILDLTNLDDREKAKELLSDGWASAGMTQTGIIILVEVPEQKIAVPKAK